MRTRYDRMLSSGFALINGYSENRNPSRLREISSEESMIYYHNQLKNGLGHLCGLTIKPILTGEERKQRARKVIEENMRKLSGKEYEVS